MNLLSIKIKSQKFNKMKNNNKIFRQSKKMKTKKIHLQRENQV